MGTTVTNHIWNYSVSGLCPLSEIVNIRKCSISEIGSVSIPRCGEGDIYPVGAQRKS
jgi:hypothetical protein